MSLKTDLRVVKSQFEQLEFIVVSIYKLSKYVNLTFPQGEIKIERTEIEKSDDISKENGCKITYLLTDKTALLT